MGNQFSNLIKKHKNAVKCFLAVNYHCQQALLELLHSNGVPSDPEELFQFFNTNEKKAKINKLQKKKILKSDQVNLLLPQNQRTFSQKWDITLITLVIIHFSSLLPPSGGSWKIKDPDTNDVTAGACVLNIRNTRNSMNHAAMETLKDENTLNGTFTAVDMYLVNLNYSRIAEFRGMNIEAFDPALFMDTIHCPKEKKDVIVKCLQWYKTENEKSKFFSLFLTCEI